MMQGYFPEMMGNYGWGLGGMFMGFIFLILIGILVFFVIRFASRSGFGSSGETPLEILKKRYAKGEISKDDFEKMKKDISN